MRISFSHWHKHQNAHTEEELTHNINSPNCSTKLECSPLWGQRFPSIYIIPGFKKRNLFLKRAGSLQRELRFAFFIYKHDAYQAQSLHKAKRGYVLRWCVKKGRITENYSDLNMAILPSGMAEDKVHRQLCYRSTCQWNVFHPSYCKTQCIVVIMLMSRHSWS